MKKYLLESSSLILDVNEVEFQKLKKQIETVLKPDNRLWDEEGILNQIKLIEFAIDHDEKIIGLLYDDESLRKKFFLKIKEIFIFKTNDFQFFMEENKIDNSLTAYKNRIGLTDGKKFIKDTNDVVLNFPYKDCVLEGGQSTEEGSDTYFKIDDKALGIHIIAEFHGCTNISNVKTVEKVLVNSAYKARATVLKSHIHDFGDGLGVTGVVILSESHISIHSWPEYEYAAIDIFTCGNALPMNAIEYMKTQFLPQNVQFTSIERGDINNGQ